jgi:porin-like protein
VTPERKPAAASAELRYDAPMRTTIYATLLAALPICATAAELPKKTTPAPRETRGNPCAAYGAGFVRVEGTTTCVKVGGTVRVESGRSK